MALVSATASPATLHLSAAGACSLPQRRRPLLPAPLRAAAKGANSTPVVLESKAKKRKGSGAGNLPGALDVEIRDAQAYLDSDEQVFSAPALCAGRLNFIGNNMHVVPS
jgi:complement component 1 Q subcomponent-binding protein, mitochondrial